MFLVAFSINSLQVEKRVGKQAKKHDGSFRNFEYDLNLWINEMPEYAIQFSIPMPLLLGSLCFCAFIIIVNLLEIQAASFL